MRDMGWLALKALGALALIAGIVAVLYWSEVALQRWRARIYHDEFKRIEREEGRAHDAR